MFKRSFSWVVIITFVFSLVCPYKPAHADVLNLPAPGSMINLSPVFEPALIKGLIIHKNNPFLFDFIVDTGHSGLSGDALKKEGDRLIKYFFVCLTIPKKDLWVNLSPYEKDRMIPQALGQTALGRDLLAQDYILKQLTASLIYPEKNLGREFWNIVYAKARQMYGTTQIPVNTFNKVWILADEASVYEHGQTAFVVSGHLKVMLDEDYLALRKHSAVSQANQPNTINKPHSIASQIVRNIILPEIEKEVNTGKNFSVVRQIFYSQILAVWYKNNLKESLLNQVYADKSTVKGVNLQDPSAKEKIYQQYLRAYKKGVFNYIKEDSLADGQTVPRKYFSGGYYSADFRETVTQNPAVAARAEKPTGVDEDFKVALKVNGAGLAMKSANDTAMTAGEFPEESAMRLFNEAKQSISSHLMPLARDRVRHKIREAETFEQLIEAFQDLKREFPGLNSSELSTLINLRQRKANFKKLEEQLRRGRIFYANHIDSDRLMVEIISANLSKELTKTQNSALEKKFLNLGVLISRKTPQYLKSHPSEMGGLPLTAFFTPTFFVTSPTATDFLVHNPPDHFLFYYVVANLSGRVQARFVLALFSADAAMSAKRSKENAAMTRALINQYGTQISKFVPNIRAWRPNYPPGVVPHLNSHQDQINDLKAEGLLSKTDADLMRIFVEGHDYGYSLNLKNAETLDQLERIWEQIGQFVLGYEEAKSKEIAKRLRNFIANHADNYMVAQVIAHGTSSILPVMKKFQEYGFNENQALGMALMFAAHHPGYPITMVHRFVIPGVIPEEFVPVLLITDLPQKGISNADESLRHKAADAAAKLLNIPRSEARYYATLGYALDRITPARMMTTFSMNDFELHDDGTYQGQVQWGGSGEISRKYPLIITNIKDKKELTVAQVFQRTIVNLKAEAAAAAQSAELMARDLPGATPKDTDDLRSLVTQRSAFEINRTEQMQNKILEMIKEKLPGFSGDLTAIDPLIRQSQEFYSKIGASEPESYKSRIEYLLGFLITIKTSSLAQGHIKKLLDAAMKAEQTKSDKVVLVQSPGGIDLDATNMDMTVTKDANGGIQVNFDPAMIEQIRKKGVHSAVPVVINVTTLNQAQIRPLLGLPQ